MKLFPSFVVGGNDFSHSPVDMQACGTYVHAPTYAPKHTIPPTQGRGVGREGKEEGEEHGGGEGKGEGEGEGGGKGERIMVILYLSSSSQDIFLRSRLFCNS